MQSCSTLGSFLVVCLVLQSMLTFDTVQSRLNVIKNDDNDDGSDPQINIIKVGEDGRPIHTPDHAHDDPRHPRYQEHKENFAQELKDRHPEMSDDEHQRIMDRRKRKQKQREQRRRRVNEKESDIINADRRKHNPQHDERDYEEVIAEHLKNNNHGRERGRGRAEFDMDEELDDGAEIGGERVEHVREEHRLDEENERKRRRRSQERDDEHDHEHEHELPEDIRQEMEDRRRADHKLHEQESEEYERNREFNTKDERVQQRIKDRKKRLDDKRRRRQSMRDSHDAKPLDPSDVDLDGDYENLERDMPDMREIEDLEEMMREREEALHDFKPPLDENGRPRKPKQRRRPHIRDRKRNAERERRMREENIQDMRGKKDL